jgi:hypothetical protein
MYAAGLRYIHAQEYGGTIRPRSRRFLTVPLPGALTAAGVTRGGARLVNRGGRWQTADGRPTVIFTGRSGYGIIAEVRGEGRNRRLNNLYVLRPFVRLRPRLGFRKTFQEETLPFIDQELGKVQA